MINLEVDKNATYLLAGNCGSDSMALAHMLEEQGAHYIFCFVNYHLGKEWEEAEEFLVNYCKSHNITIEICNADEIDQTGREENFEKWARKIRYDFFNEIYKKYDAVATYIPHQQDDVIENYLVQKETGIKGSKFGVQTVATSRDMFIKRPLIIFSREDLLEYCQLNNVPFLNFSNYQQDASKSEIRRNVVANLSAAEREMIILKITKAKNEIISFSQSISTSAAKVESLNIREIIALSEGMFADAVIRYVKAHAKERVKITPKILEALRKMCLDKKPNMTLHIQGNVYFVKEYDEISIDNDGLDLPYHYVFEEPCEFHCESFDMDFRKGAEDRNIHPEDYPITVRSILPGDIYAFGGYAVVARQMLVAAGIPERLLQIWPVFLNKDGKIIYVPRYKKGFSEYHEKSRLRIHVKDEEK